MQTDIDIEYDHAARIVRLTPRGKVSRAEAMVRFRAMCEELAAQSAAHDASVYGILIDTRHSSTVPTTPGIAAAVDEIAMYDDRTLPKRWAIIATEPAQYGMGRVFAAYADAHGLEVGVFTTEGSATAWLTRPR